MLDKIKAIFSKKQQEKVTFIPTSINQNQIDLDDLDDEDFDYLEAEFDVYAKHFHSLSSKEQEDLLIHRDNFKYMQ
ncbi:hypothetical protein [Photobacterium sp. GB-72]|uniref:hypothetical protein n=1 Tax=Photobacterium sp. GB-72 TaxID=2022105 RepID=UPI000D15DAE3|nr:hypothetical protein [Photobacterium sp. GB-72]PSV30330.1 hypothetical protein C9J40_13690 [Photobacterium sp. GB-72]